MFLRGKHSFAKSGGLTSGLPKSQLSKNFFLLFLFFSALVGASCNLREDNL